jgi:signal transduction histidine kinase
MQTTEEERTEFLGDVLGSGKHLLSLINEVLDLAKVESGTAGSDSGTGTCRRKNRSLPSEPNPCGEESTSRQDSERKRNDGYSSADRRCEAEHQEGAGCAQGQGPSHARPP